MTLWNKLQVILKHENYAALSGADQRTADLIAEGLDGLGEPTDYVVRGYLYPYMVTFIESKYKRFS